MHQHLYADLQNADADGRIRMNTVGTLKDLERLRLSLSDGLAVELYTDDGDSERGLTIPGTIEFNKAEGIWAAVVDWSRLVCVGGNSVTEIMDTSQSR